MKIVFNLNANSDPGRDDFGGYFYPASQDIIGLDMCNAVKQLSFYIIRFFRR